MKRPSGTLVSAAQTVSPPGVGKMNFSVARRFDTIFIVKDEHNEERDITLAKHVMSIHVNAGSAAAADAAAQDEGELSIQVYYTFSPF